MNKSEETLGAKQIIVIDDDNATLFLCKIIISRAFLNLPLSTFINPEKAVEYFKNDFSNVPMETVVILDINMPQMSGWEVLDQLSLLDNHLIEKLNVVMLSSSIDPIDNARASKHPMVAGYLEKPLNIPSLKNLFTSVNSNALI